jgi:hypothetical protein
MTAYTSDAGFSGSKFSENEFGHIYSPIEGTIFAEELYFDIGVPILFVKFDFDTYAVDKNIVVRRISDKSHLARFKIKSTSRPIPDPIISAATHEVVFSGHFRGKKGKWYQNSFDNEDLFPIQSFDNFLNAIKIAANINTGYEQILVYPSNWVNHFEYDLPDVAGVSIKKYPSTFDNFHWNIKELPTIGSEKIEEIGDIFRKLQNNREKKIAISCRRLRISCLRDNEEDSILDIIIALELLLSDNEKGELTHKLALRVAKLFSLYLPEENPLEVFGMVKKIYDYRSAIVHGSDKASQKREIVLKHQNITIEAVALANNYLREILKILLNNAKYLNPNEIDKAMISGS